MEAFPDGTRQLVQGLRSAANTAAVVPDNPIHIVAVRTRRSNAPRKRSFPHLSLLAEVSFGSKVVLTALNATSSLPRTTDIIRPARLVRLVPQDDIAGRGKQ